MLKNGWTRDLHIAGGALIIHKDKLIVTERKCHLVCIEPETGDVIWDTKIEFVYGWLTAIDDKVIYFEKFGTTRIIDFDSGKVINIHQMRYGFMGYVIPYKNYLISGLWRGYTDLICINIETDFKIEWKRATRSKDVTFYSVPMILDNSLIFSDNSNHKFSKIDVATGDEIWTIDLPSDIDWLDLDYTFQIDNGRVIVYSKNGGIYKLDMDDLNWEKVV